MVHCDCVTVQQNPNTPSSPVTINASFVTHIMEDSLNGGFVPATTQMTAYTATITITPLTNNDIMNMNNNQHDMIIGSDNKWFSIATTLLAVEQTPDTAGTHDVMLPLIVTTLQELGFPNNVCFAVAGLTLA